MLYVLIIGLVLIPLLFYRNKKVLKRSSRLKKDYRQRLKQRLKEDRNNKF